MEEIYRSAFLALRYVPCADTSRWIVTFDHHSGGAGLNRPGFGERHFRERGVSAVHVLGRGNDWYQYPDILAAAAIVREATGGAVGRLAYGSSMGGYAALRLADAIGATRVLALSPQYSNDPAEVPWETRWLEDGRRMPWRPELSGPLRCGCRPVVLFDPTGPDRRHADLIRADVPATIAIPAPYSGHPAGSFLSEIGLLDTMVIDLLAGVIDPAEVAARMRAGRAGSTVYLATLAERQPPWRAATKFALARQAVAVNRGSVLAVLALARVLGEAGRHGEALTWHEEAVATSGRAAAYLVPYADALAAAGQPRAAAAVAREVVDHYSSAGYLRHWLADLLFRIGDYPAAIREQRHAVRLDPGNGGYRQTLALYRTTWRRRVRRWARLPVVKLVRRWVSTMASARPVGRRVV